MARIAAQRYRERARISHQKCTSNSLAFAVRCSLLPFPVPVSDLTPDNGTSTRTDAQNGIRYGIREVRIKCIPPPPTQILPQTYIYHIFTIEVCRYVYALCCGSGFGNLRPRTPPHFIALCISHKYDQRRCLLLLAALTVLSVLKGK